MGKKKNKKRRSSGQKSGGESPGGSASTAPDGAPKAKKRRKHSKHGEHPPSSDPDGQSKSSLSLAQLLKKHRGVAANTSPPPSWRDIRVDGGRGSRRNNFLTPQDDPRAFEDCLRTSYAGFHYDAPDKLPPSLHRDFESSFSGMERGGLFLYDVVQPGKKRLARTSVTRTLVGDPGSTYKYLGLRLFSHPWVDVDKNGGATKESNNGSTLRKLGYSVKTTSALISMGLVNSILAERSKAMLDEHVSSHVSPVGMVGSADFNLTLVNKMESTATKKDLKKEVGYGMGKISVGWHRDSGLKDFSTIAVYQTLKEHAPSKSGDGSWGVALRAMDGGAGGPLADVPPLMVPLPSGSLYYMLDEFNHNHEHAVIAGSSGTRYSSTHRVAREGQGTWQYMRDKVQALYSAATAFDFDRGKVNLDSPLKKQREKLVSHVRMQQTLTDEIEFEWLRQWFVQGQKHASLHPYWHRPISILTNAFLDLEKSSCKIVNLLKVPSKDEPEKSLVTEDLYDVLIEALVTRSKLRASWKYRYRDPIFATLPADERPFPCSCLDRDQDSEECMPEDLDLLISNLRRWRSAFVVPNATESNETKQNAKKSKKRQKSKSGSLTKKESRQRASNWERLKAKL